VYGLMTSRCVSHSILWNLSEEIRLVFVEHLKKAQVYLLLLSISTGSQLLLANEQPKIASINIQCLSHSWMQRYEFIATELASQNPDIIALQEACTEGGTDGIAFMVDKLAQRGWRTQAKIEQFTHVAYDRFDEYVVLLSRLPVEAREGGKLPYSPLTRSYAALKVAGTWYVNTHLEHKDEWSHYRSAQIGFLRNRFANESVILMGDWNSHESYPAHDPYRGIDGFWVGPQYRGHSRSLHSYRFLDLPMASGGYASDHVGLILEP
jgi:endonuclease/exonuclease/phosphatase (EEP) superfamily protein YafD